MKTHEAVDVVIMGAGAAGALFAARLGEAGRKVVVLEAGPAWAMTDLVSSQIWSRRLKWGGAPVESTGRNRFGHNMAVGWGVGGSALHHYAGWPRLQPADFSYRTAFGRGLDWPIGYEDLRPWYDKVQAEVGISGDAKAEVWRPNGAPYPMPSMKSFRQGAIISRGFAKLGMHVAPAPMAVASVAFNDRPPCQYDGWCDAGCPTGALLNPLVMHVPAAHNAGVVFRAGATVTRIETDGLGRAIGLRYVDDKGAAQLQPAALVVLAGAAVQNARLMLASVSARHRDGFGNPSDLVGRYFNAHSMANAYGLFDEATECEKGLTAGTLTCQDEYAKQRSGGPFGSITWGIAPAVKPNDLLGIANTRPDLFGADLDTFLHRARTNMGSMNGIVENVPLAENRITLSGAKDRNGVPLARVTHGVDPNGEALWQLANVQGAAVMRAAGASEVWATPMITLAHVAGGTVMGRTAVDSVVNSFGQVHDQPNVLVAGGGQFPSVGAVSPTFTVMALAERAIDRLLREGQEFRV